MKSTKTLIIAITLTSIITLTGCGAKNAQSASQQSNTQATSTDKSSSTKEKKFTSIDDASENMRTLLKGMKSQVANKEDAKVSESGTKLKDEWTQFEDQYEDNLKDKYLDLYVKIEDPLEIIEAAAKVKPLDTNVIYTSIDKLDNELAELQKKCYCNRI